VIKRDGEKGEVFAREREREKEDNGFGASSEKRTGDMKGNELKKRS